MADEQAKEELDLLTEMLKDDDISSKTLLYEEKDTSLSGWPLVFLSTLTDIKNDLKSTQISLMRKPTKLKLIKWKYRTYRNLIIEYNLTE